MSMTVGELFVNLGVKGTEKTVSAVANVRKGMSDVGSASLEAKAGILAVLYGFERLVQGSNATGNSLTLFNNNTGMSVDRLQRWQYLLRQSGVDASEAQSSMEGLQKVMYQISHGIAAPAGLKYISEILGKHNMSLDITKMSKDTDYAMQMMREFMKYADDIPRANQALNEMGMSTNVGGAFRTSKVDLDKVPKSALYSDKEVANLAKMDIAWSNLTKKIEMGIGHLNAKHGMSLIQDITKMTDQLMKFADTLLVIAERLKIFQVIGDVFDGLTKAMRLMNGESLDNITKGDEKKHHFGDGTWWMKGLHGMEDMMAGGLLTNQAARIQQAPVNNTTNVTVHTAPLRDAHAVGSEVKKQINHAHRTSPVHKGGQ